ncbi:MAG: hypothetical protein ACTSRK_17760 [Promethearchaeota archaeon]
MEQIENSDPNEIINQSRKKLSKRELTLVIIVLGAFELIIGVLSWLFTIPFFSLFYFGEIIGIIFIVVGVKQLQKQRRRNL